MEDLNGEEGLLSYDLKSLPDNVSIDKLVYIMKEMDIIFWDSFNKGTKPEILKDFTENKLILDSSTEEGKKKLNEISKLLEDETKK